MYELRMVVFHLLNRLIKSVLGPVLPAPLFPFASLSFIFPQHAILSHLVAFVSAPLRSVHSSMVTFLKHTLKRQYRVLQERASVIGAAISGLQRPLSTLGFLFLTFPFRLVPLFHSFALFWAPQGRGHRLRPLPPGLLPIVIISLSCSSFSLSPLPLLCPCLQYLLSSLHLPLSFHFIIILFNITYLAFFWDSYLIVFVASLFLLCQFNANTIFSYAKYVLFSHGDSFSHLIGCISLVKSFN